MEERLPESEINGNGNSLRQDNDLERGGTERETTEERVPESEINGDGNSLPEDDEFNPDSPAVKCFNWNHLHVAASRGHAHIFKTLLDSDLELAEALDSHQRSLLHLASANGHIEIVKALTKVRPEMCLARDRDGANPLHVAAMRGQVEVFDELYKANPHAVRARVERGEKDTILHLCVKYNQLEFLKLLLEKFKSEEFVNAKDDAGNTILHIAVADQRFEIIKYVLCHTKIDVNAKNARKHTAMDILLPVEGQGTKPEGADWIKDILRNSFHARRGKKKPEGEESNTIEDLLQNFRAKRAKDAIDPKWLAKKRNALIIVAVLLATMAFQAGVTPPGGVWQDNNGHTGGEAVMAYNYPHLYKYFLRSNTVGFVASLSTILLLISELPFNKRRYVWALVAIMCLAITSMAFTYSFSITVVTPKWERKALTRTIEVAVVVWCSVTAIVLLVHVIRTIASFVGTIKSRDKAVRRLKRLGISLGGDPKPCLNQVPVNVVND